MLRVLSPNVSDKVGVNAYHQQATSINPQIGWCCKNFGCAPKMFRRKQPVIWAMHINQSTPPCVRCWKKNASQCKDSFGCSWLEICYKLRADVAPQKLASPPASCRLEGTKAATSPEALNPATSERVGWLDPGCFVTKFHLPGFLSYRRILFLHWTTLRKNPVVCIPIIVWAGDLGCWNVKI